MQRKKIIQIITKSNFGGAQKYVYELSKDLKEKDHEVLVAFGGDGILKEKLEEQNIRTHQLKSLNKKVNILSDIKVFFEIIKLIKKEKPDVVHLHSSKIGAIGSLAGWFCFVPKVIFSIHGLAFNENRGFISKIIIKKIYWLTILFSTVSIAVSENVKEQILKIPLSFVIKNKIKVVVNQIKPIDFYTKEESLNFISKKINKDLSGKKIIGSIAELHHIKGINYFIDSAAKILENEKNYIFVVFGDGEEREKLQEQIENLNIQNNFFLLGFVDNAPKYLKGLDLFVLPSLYEALALVILEAKQAELKIVASKTGGIPEAIDNYPNTEMFSPKNSDDLAVKIKYSMNKKIETSFFYKGNFNNMVEKIINIYNS